MKESRHNRVSVKQYGKSASSKVKFDHSDGNDVSVIQDANASTRDSLPAGSLKRVEHTRLSRHSATVKDTTTIRPLKDTSTRTVPDKEAGKPARSETWQEGIKVITALLAAITALVIAIRSLFSAVNKTRSKPKKKPAA